MIESVTINGRVLVKVKVVDIIGQRPETNM